VKKLILVIAVIFSLIGGASAVYAAGGFTGPNSTTTSIIVTSENVEMAVKPPLEVTGWTGITINWQEGKTNPVYAGQTIGEGKITILNVSPIPQAVRLSAQAMSVGSDAWPTLEIIAKSSTDTFRAWQPILLRPGKAIDLTIEVKVAYGSPVSTFKGVKLEVSAGPPSETPERG